VGRRNEDVVCGNAHFLRDPSAHGRRVSELHKVSYNDRSFGLGIVEHQRTHINLVANTFKLCSPEICQASQVGRSDVDLGYRRPQLPPLSRGRWQRASRHESCQNNKSE